MVVHRLLLLFQTDWRVFQICLKQTSSTKKIKRVDDDSTMLN